MIDIVDGKLKISVRHLVEFLCRGGDLDNRFGGVTDKRAMDAGSRVHKKIQKAMGPDYMAEVPLLNVFETENYSVIVDGRADGIFSQNEYVFIDEIKGTYRDIRFINEPNPVHRAQAMCYAHFYCEKMSLAKIGVRLTYVNLDDEAVKYFEEYFEADTLREWYSELVARLCIWGDYVFYHKNRRNESIEKLKFPFEYRKGQRNLAVNVYRAIENGENLFIQAPTGVGKTISTVFPSVMSVGAGKGDKIFYLTAKTITRTVAEEAFAVLRENGLVFNTVTITAKEKICQMKFDEGAQCNPIMCPYAKGHFDRVNDAVYDVITNVKVITRPVIEEYANKHTVCPFELTLDISYWMDAVICDYNYAFDPHVYLKRFFSEVYGRDYIFLVDEAHNLVDRAREMYSATVLKEDFLRIKRMVSSLDRRLANSLESCNKELLALKRTCDNDYMVAECPDSFAVKLQRLEELIIKFMENNRNFEQIKEISEFYFDISHFNGMYESIENDYVCYMEHTSKGFMLKLFCVNPSGQLAQRLVHGKATVFFSATLLPVNYYKEMLSGNKEDMAIYAHSPFDTGNRLLFVANDVTSRYTRRNISEYLKIMDYIKKLYLAHPGNYIVFFPSYKYMEDVYSCNEDCSFYDKIIIQKKEMDEEERENFLSMFEEKDSCVIGFCVMGGIFSEGIDLKNDALIGTVIVGPGLPSINTESQILRDYYDEKEKCGYEYAYIYPGMNKVLQAAGRVIRTDTDRGVIALLDDRFLNSQYRSLFPYEWSDCKVLNLKSVEQETLDFWSHS